MLKAALNRAWKAGKITTDSAWRRVEVFHSVAGVRTRYLSVPEAKRLVNVCPPDFHELVQGALATGARYGQLCALKASDFNPAQNTVRLTSRKGRGVEKTYYAILADEGAAFFKGACFGLAGTDHIFKKADGSPWTEGDQFAPMAEACVNAKLQPIGFHGLRHTWASLSVMAGMPLIVVARNLGHASTKMVEQHPPGGLVYRRVGPRACADVRVLSAKAVAACSGVDSFVRSTRDAAWFVRKHWLIVGHSASLSPNLVLLDRSRRSASRRFSGKADLP